MSQSKPARSVRRRCARKARSNKAVGHQPQRTELVVDTCEPSAVTAVDPAEGQIDYVRRKPVPARSSVAPPYFGSGARIAASAFSSASIFDCMAVSCALSAPTLKKTSFSTGASSLAA